MTVRGPRELANTARRRLSTGTDIRPFTSDVPEESFADFWRGSGKHADRHVAAWEEWWLFWAELRAADQASAISKEAHMTSTVATAREIRPFHIDVPEEALDDLRRRIKG